MESTPETGSPKLVETTKLAIRPARQIDYGSLPELPGSGDYHQPPLLIERYLATLPSPTPTDKQIVEAANDSNVPTDDPLLTELRGLRHSQLYSREGFSVEQQARLNQLEQAVAEHQVRVDNEFLKDHLPAEVRLVLSDIGFMTWKENHAMDEGEIRQITQAIENAINEGDMTAIYLSLRARHQLVHENYEEYKKLARNLDPIVSRDYQRMTAQAAGKRYILDSLETIMRVQGLVPTPEVYSSQNLRHNPGSAEVPKTLKEYAQVLTAQSSPKPI